MPKAKVNGVEVEFEAGMTALQVCELAGEEIPRFCYHERLSIAGNCRMCLVEVKPGPPKPQASCALPAAEGQEIFTRTPMVKKAREGVMEFLLINHPLDCPICDQGGECDLQDEALAYGRDDSRYLENKRAVEEKYMGPVIKTIMTRCIQCTRCVRFATEIAGVSELGLINRGEDAEITTYLENAVTSELSGNLADVCPVGALTHKPWAFNYRQWELKKAESIDVMDAVGSNIVVHARGPEVMRILPRTKESINEEWLADRSRYTPDGLMRQRLDRPYVRIEGRLREATWAQAFAAISSRIQATTPNRMGVIAGDLCDAESMKAALDLFGGMGVASLDCRQDGATLGTGPREGWLFNTTIEGLEHCDALLLVGTNPRREAPILNARIRKTWLRGGLSIGVIGEGGARPVLRLRPSGRRRFGAARLRRERRRLRQGVPRGEAAGGDRGAGRADPARRDGDPEAGRRAGPGARGDRGRAGLERLQRAAHRRRAGRRAGPGLCPARGRAGRGRHGGRGGGGGARLPGPAGRRRDRHAAARERVRGLYRVARGRGRQPGGRDPAGRGLHREARDLRQHRGPGADRRAGDLPQGRRQGGLGPSCARCPRCWAPSSPTTPSRNCGSG